MAEGDYLLTREEYEEVCENFYEAQNLLRVLRAAVSSNVEMPIESMDVETACNAILERLKTIEPYLGK